MNRLLTWTINVDSVLQYQLIDAGHFAEVTRFWSLVENTAERSTTAVSHPLNKYNTCQNTTSAKWTGEADGCFEKVQYLDNIFYFWIY